VGYGTWVVDRREGVHAREEKIMQGKALGSPRGLGDAKGHR
jgi:hypothetical protein